MGSGPCLCFVDVAERVEGQGIGVVGCVEIDRVRGGDGDLSADGETGVVPESR